MKYKLLSIIFLCVFSKISFSQQDTATVVYNFAVTGSLAKGNLEQFRIAETCSFKYTDKFKGFLLEPNFSYGTFSNFKIEKDFSVRNINYLFPKNRFFVFHLLKYEKSLRRQIDYRWQTGLGIGSNLFQNIKGNSLISFGIVYDRTNYYSNIFSEIDTLGSDIRNTLKGSLLLAGTQKINKGNIIVGYQFWYQQTIDLLLDKRLQSIVNLDFKLHKNIYFRTTIFYFYESIVVKNIKNNDLLISFGINFSKI